MRESAETRKGGKCKMKTINNIYIGNEGISHTTTQEDFNHCFMWKVDITYIHRRCPNFEIGSLVRRNK